MCMCVCVSNPNLLQLESAAVFMWNISTHSIPCLCPQKGHFSLSGLDLGGAAFSCPSSNEDMDATCFQQLDDDLGFQK